MAMKFVSWVPLVCLLAACEASPYVRERHDAAGPDFAGRPVPTADHPEARSYLQAVLVANTSEAEYPLFEALNRRPLEQTRPLLEALGMIQDYHLTKLATMPPGGAGVPWEEGWEKAVNNRYRLIYRQAFEVAGSIRRGWVFQGDLKHAGNELMTTRCGILALLTSEDYQVVRFEKFQTFQMARAVKANSQAAGSLSVEFQMRNAVAADRVEFLAEGIHFVAGR